MDSTPGLPEYLLGAEKVGSWPLMLGEIPNVKRGNKWKDRERERVTIADPMNISQGWVWSRLYSNQLCGSCITIRKMLEKSFDTDPIFTCMNLISIGYRENSEVLFEPIFTLLAQIPAQCWSLVCWLYISQLDIEKWTNKIAGPRVNWLLVAAGVKQWKEKQHQSMICCITICWLLVLGHCFHYLHDWLSFGLGMVIWLVRLGDIVRVVWGNFSTWVQWASDWLAESPRL
jgi:hypothetical protein